MGKLEKLISKFLENNPNLSYKDADKILTFLGYEPRQPRSGSSHVIYEKPDRDIITLVLNKTQLLPYQITKVQKALEDEGYTDE
jgi:predicted RNA binding protein YcfA (HicA-like mRNA interferase family)